MDIDEIMEDVPLGNVYSGSLQEVVDSGKKYKLIYLDPPWKYGNSRWSNKGVGKLHYPRMEEDEIAALPVPQLADSNCIMFMWTTAVHLPTSLRLIEHWGFTYKTVGFTWVKLKRDGVEPVNGPGSYTRSASEFCLIATRGSGFTTSRKDCNVNQVILSIRREHSRKPDEAILCLQRLFGDISRIELFSRCPREGWDVWGNEPTKFT